MDTIERPISEFTKKCLSKWWGKVGDGVAECVYGWKCVVMVLTNARLSRNTKYTILCDFSVNSQIPQ